MICSLADNVGKRTNTVIPDSLHKITVPLVVFDIEMYTIGRISISRSSTSYNPHYQYLHILHALHIEPNPIQYKVSIPISFPSHMNRTLCSGAWWYVDRQMVKGPNHVLYRYVTVM